MSGALEQRYRRLLRLLPMGYRYHWEEEMVGAFMEGEHASPVGDASGRLLAERLSVAALAARLRLDGSHATPRGVIWYQAWHGFALMILLYQALAATLLVAIRVPAIAVAWPLGLADFGFLVPYPASSLLWVAAFACFVMGRLVASRVLVALAAVSTVVITVTMSSVVASGGGYVPPFNAADISRWGWLAVSVIVVFLCPRIATASRPLWFGAYLLGSLVLVPVALNAFASFGLVQRYADLTDAVSAITMVAMAVALLPAILGRRPAVRWLLALAVFGGGVAAVRLMTGAAAVRPAHPEPRMTTF